MAPGWWSAAGLSGSTMAMILGGGQGRGSPYAGTDATTRYVWRDQLEGTCARTPSSRQFIMQASAWADLHKMGTPDGTWSSPRLHVGRSTRRLYCETGGWCSLDLGHLRRNFGRATTALAQLSLHGPDAPWRHQARGNILVNAIARKRYAFKPRLILRGSSKRSSRAGSTPRVGPTSAARPAEDARTPVRRWLDRQYAELGLGFGFSPASTSDVAAHWHELKHRTADNVFRQ